MFFCVCLSKFFNDKIVFKKVLKYFNLKEKVFYFKNVFYNIKAYQEKNFWEEGGKQQYPKMHTQKIFWEEGGGGKFSYDD